MKLNKQVVAVGLLASVLLEAGHVPAKEPHEYCHDEAPAEAPAILQHPAIAASGSPLSGWPPPRLGR